MTTRLTLLLVCSICTLGCGGKGFSAGPIASPSGSGSGGQPAITAGAGAAGTGASPTAGRDAGATPTGAGGRGPAAATQDAGARPPSSEEDSGTREPDPMPTDAGPVRDAGPPTSIPADSPAPRDVSRWSGKGPFNSKVINNSGPDGRFTVFVPDPLAGNGTRNPILTWGNGSATTPSSYRALLSHYATHGFFVVASNSTNVGSGKEMIAGMRWAIAENQRSGSMFFGKLDPDEVGSIGYSQGGIGAVIAGNEPEVKTTVPIAGGDATVKNIVHPIFLIGNEDDTAAPIDVIGPQFTSKDTKGPFVFGILLGTGHLETLGDGGRHRGYSTAWLAYHLAHDMQAYRVFYGNDKCTLCVDPAWKTERKNLP